MGNSQASGAVGEASSPEERERAFEELCVGYDQKTGSEQLHAAEAIELHKKGKLFLSKKVKLQTKISISKKEDFM